MMSILFSLNDDNLGADAKKKMANDGKYQE